MNAIITIETPKQGSYATGYDKEVREVETDNVVKYVDDLNRELRHTSRYAYVGKR